VIRSTVAGVAASRRGRAGLGEMLEPGAASAAAHEAAGRLAVWSGVQRVVAVGEGAAEGEGTVAVPDVGSALALLRADARPGDVVLVTAPPDSDRAEGVGAR
jgi:UDP-N-acetylmuramoyl-tripeptide--D-alanyl-D-alanine ligase